MSQPHSAPGGLQPLAPMVVHTLRQIGLGRVVLIGRIHQRWAEIAGAQLAAVAQPEAIRGRVLFITVCDAIWLQQLTFYHTQLLQKIHDVLGDVPIARLHFTLAPSPQLSAPSQTAGVAASMPLSTEEERQVQEGTVSIADPELRAIVQRAWRQGWQVRREGR